MSSYVRDNRPYTHVCRDPDNGQSAISYHYSRAAALSAAWRHVRLGGVDRVQVDSIGSHEGAVMVTRDDD